MISSTCSTKFPFSFSPLPPIHFPLSLCICELFIFVCHSLVNIFVLFALTKVKILCMRSLCGPVEFSTNNKTFFFWLAYGCFLVEFSVVHLACVYYDHFCSICFSFRFVPFRFLLRCRTISYFIFVIFIAALLYSNNIFRRYFHFNSFVRSEDENENEQALSHDKRDRFVYSVLFHETFSIVFAFIACRLCVQVLEIRVYQRADTHRFSHNPSVKCDCCNSLGFVFSLRLFANK